jgi:hypothetical protein
VDSQNERHSSTHTAPANSAPTSKKRRFQLVKLEERIAPDKGGMTNKPHPCGGGGGSSASSGTFFGECGSIY